MNLDCFKAYDIRGRVPDDLNEHMAWRIGKAYADEFKPGTVVVGRDVRLESPMLAAALTRGLTAGGANVIDIGLCGTEEVYFHAFHRQQDGVGGGIMVTASHNPKGYNGMKLVREGAKPISGDTGLIAIRDRVASMEAFSHAPAGHAEVREEPSKAAYIDHLLSYVDRAALKPLRIVADPGNGAAGPVVRLLAERLPFSMVLIQDEPDGHFPNGVPNPLLPEMRTATARAVVAHGADFGVAWDGDFDRCFLFDAEGRFIEGYYLVGLLAEVLLAKHPGAKIIHDPRLTWNTIAQVKEAGGIPVQSKTGHAFIKERMRKEDAVYGGEMSAHHYFRDFAYCDSGMIPWLLVAELISKTGKTLAELVGARMTAYPCSGEINFQVDDVPAVIERILAHFADRSAAGQSGRYERPTIDRTDGVSVEFPDWRFNLRGSNTEPLLRLNVETRGDSASLDRHLASLKRLILATG